MRGLSHRMTMTRGPSSRVLSRPLWVVLVKVPDQVRVQDVPSRNPTVLWAIPVPVH